MRSQRSAAVGAERPCAYGVVRARPLCLSGVRLGPTEGRSPTSLAELTIRREPYRVEVRLQLPRVDGLPCRVRAVGLRRELVVQHVLWAPADATSARARFSKDAPEQHSRYTSKGGTRFLFGFRGLIVHLQPTKPKTVGAGVVSGFTARIERRQEDRERQLTAASASPSLRLSALVARRLPRRSGAASLLCEIGSI